MMTLPATDHPFARFLEDEFKRRGHSSRKRFSNAIGVHKGTVTDWVSHGCLPKGREVFYRIADYFEVEPVAVAALCDISLSCSAADCVDHLTGNSDLCEQHRKEHHNQLRKEWKRRQSNYESPKLKRGPYAGCWEWQGSRGRNGYGKTTEPGHRSNRVHRIVYAEYFGPIPDGMAVCHRCDNPPCFRPDHLFLATHQENMNDMNLKGRARGPKHERRADILPGYCLRGHPKKRGVSGRRWCPTCTNAGQRAKNRGTTIEIELVGYFGEDMGADPAAYRVPGVSYGNSL